MIGTPVWKADKTILLQHADVQQKDVHDQVANFTSCKGEAPMHMIIVHDSLMIRHDFGQPRQ